MIQFIRPTQLANKLNLAKPPLYQRAVGWRESEIEAWFNEKAEEAEALS